MGKRRKRKHQATIFELFGRKKSNIEKVAEMIEEQHIYNQRVKAVFGTLGYLQGVDENTVSGEDFKRLVSVVEELADIVFGNDVDFDTVTDQYNEDDTDEIVAEDLLFRTGNGPAKNMLKETTAIDRMIREDAINESIESDNDL